MAQLKHVGAAGRAVGAAEMSLDSRPGEHARLSAAAVGGGIRGAVGKGGGGEEELGGGFQSDVVLGMPVWALNCLA